MRTRGTRRRDHTSVPSVMCVVNVTRVRKWVDVRVSHRTLAPVQRRGKGRRRGRRRGSRTRTGVRRVTSAGGISVCVHRAHPAHQDSESRDHQGQRDLLEFREDLQEVVDRLDRPVRRDPLDRWDFRDPRDLVDRRVRRDPRDRWDSPDPQVRVDQQDHRVILEDRRVRWGRRVHRG